jgi:DNA-binding MarR family transcriptional regulator
MTDAPTLTSRTIGETENALQAILARTLTGTELDYHQWVALKVVSETSPPMSQAAVVQRLVGGLKIDEQRAVEVVARLQAKGTVTETDDTLLLTPRGLSLYQRLDDEIRRLAQQMWAGLDTDDLATAHRVLSTITERANSLLATSPNSVSFDSKQSS